MSDSEEVGMRLVVTGSPPRIIELGVGSDVDFDDAPLLLVLSARTAADYRLLVR